MGKISSLFKKNNQPDEADYMELDLASIEKTTPGEGPASMYVKIATINELRDTPRIKDEVYNGNIVIVDIGRLKMDKITALPSENSLQVLRINSLRFTPTLSMVKIS